MREITLGTHTLPVLAQPEPRVWRKLVPAAKELVSGIDLGDNPTLDHVVRAVEGRAYELLGLFIPALPVQMPAWEWHGYASRAAMESGEDDDEAMMRAPTHPQIVGAVEAVIAEHRWDVYGVLRQWIDPKVVRPHLNLALVRILETGTSGLGLSSLPSASGDSAQPRPSSTEPMSPSNGDSPDPEFSTSQVPIDNAVPAS